MSNTALKNATVKPDASPRHPFGALNARSQLLAMLGLTQIVLLAVALYVLYCLLHHTYFSWLHFFSLLSLLGIVNVLFLCLIWRRRNQLPESAKILAIDWAGVVIWYWIFAPIYQFTTTTLTSTQLKVNAFAYLWEVSILGGLAFLSTQYALRPVIKYLATGTTDNPEKLYRTIEWFPVRAIIRNTVFTIGGFTLGALQVHHFSNTPMVEVYKGVVLGIVLSFFLSLYYFLVFDAYLGPVRSRLLNQYHLQSIIRTRYYHKVIGLAGMLAFGCMALAVLIYVQSVQNFVRDNAVKATEQSLTKITSAADFKNQDRLEAVRHGEHGVLYVVPAGATLPDIPISQEAQERFVSTNEGHVQDSFGESKVLVFKTLESQKLVSVIYLGDYFQILPQSFQLLAIGGLFLVITAVVVLSIFSRVLYRTIRAINTSVAQAQATGNYSNNHVNTGDEFEVLDRTLGHFVEETHLKNRLLHEEHIRLQASIDSLALGFMMTDKSGKILAWNNALSELLYDKHVDKPLTLASLIASLPHHLDFTKYTARSIEHAAPITAKHVVYGMQFFDIFVSPIQSGKSLLGAAIIVQDVTEAQVLNRSKDEFFSIASHELRTPLTVIRGNTSMMLEFYDTILEKEPDLRSMIVDMHEASTGLIGIVNDFLDVSRIEQGKMKFVTEDIAIDTIVESVIYELHVITKQKGIYLRTNLKTLGSLPHVHADAGKVKQVLYNLVGNASKFTDEGGIEISITHDSRFVKITISDTGRGIPKENQKLLFRKFQQAGDSLLTRDTTRGTGLGLYISKLMVSKMGGKIGLEQSAEGKGSTFSMTLPLAKSAKANITPAS
jgi:signal transduction histidine kinase/PAS domain-containing protein